MATRQYVTPIGEYTQVWRPRHQLEWSIWEERTEIEPPFTPGFPKVFDNGQVYVVAKNGATALTRAHVVSSNPAPHTDTDLVANAPVLSNVLVLTAGGAVAENLYADGWVSVYGGTGVGLTFQVAGNDAAAAAANFNVYLKTELPVALDTTSDVRIFGSPYTNLRQFENSNQTDIVRGIPPDAIGANAYFWLQVRGPATARAHENFVATQVGRMVVPVDDGEVGNLTTARLGHQIIGYNLEQRAVSADDYMLIDLRCA